MDRTEQPERTGLIQCSDGTYAPVVCVCNHLVDGASTQWCPIPSHRPEVECDWLCPDCLGRAADLAVNDLQAICCHCAGHLRAIASLSELAHRYCVLVEQEFNEGEDCSADTAAMEAQITNGLRGLRSPLDVCVSLKNCWVSVHDNHAWLGR